MVAPWRSYLAPMLGTFSDPPSLTPLDQGGPTTAPWASESGFLRGGGGGDFFGPGGS